MLTSALTPIIMPNMSKITVEEVLKLARLSHLHLSEEEAKKYAQEIEKILAYIEQLQAIDTEGLEPTSQVTGLVNVSRPDEVGDYGLTPEELIAGTPSSHDRYIKVDRVL